MAWSVHDLVDLVRDKFIETPYIDITTPQTELQTVQLAIAAMRAWGVRMSEVIDIPQFWHLLFYHDDEYASKLIAGKDDQMQTAKATLFSLTGDCEDVHRLYQIAAVALGIPPQDSLLMVIFFGDEEKITGGHATALIRKGGAYVNLDYANVITSDAISGILNYHTRYANPVAYVLLEIDPATLRDRIVRYKDPEGFRASPEGRYSVIRVRESEGIRKLKYHLHRSSEHSDEKNKAIYLALGALAIGILVGGGLR